MGFLGATLAAQGPDGVSQLHDGMAAPDVMKLGYTPVFHVLALARTTVQVVNSYHRAFRGSNEAPDLGHHGVKVFGVLRQSAAKDGQVIEEDELTLQRPNHVVHSLKDDLLIKRSEVIE